MRLRDVTMLCEVLQYPFPIDVPTIQLLCMKKVRSIDENADPQYQTPIEKQQYYSSLVLSLIRIPYRLFLIQEGSSRQRSGFGVLRYGLFVARQTEKDSIAPRRKSGSDQKAVSCHGCRQTLFSVCGKGEACADVLSRQLREVSQNLLLAHAGSEVLKDVGDRDPHSADARFAAPLSRLNRNNLQVVHVSSIPPFHNRQQVQGRAEARRRRQEPLASRHEGTNGEFPRLPHGRSPLFEPRPDLPRRSEKAPHAARKGIQRAVRGVQGDGRRVELPSIQTRASPSKPYLREEVD